MSVVIADWIRTPIGKRKGLLESVHAVELAASAVRPLLESHAKAAADSGVLGPRGRLIVGCAQPIGEQSMNLAAAVAATCGAGSEVVAQTVDGGATSGARAFMGACDAIDARRADFAVVVATSSASRVPVGSVAGLAVGRPFGPRLLGQHIEHGGLRSPGELLEQLAIEYRIDRPMIDDYVVRSRAGAESHRRGNSVRIASVETQRNGTVKRDETAELCEVGNNPPLFDAEGVISADSFAIPADGALAVLLTTPGSVSDDSPTISSRASMASFNSPRSGFKVLEQAVDESGVSWQELDEVLVYEDAAVTPLALQHDLQLSGHRSSCDINRSGGALTWGDVSGAGFIQALLLGLDANNRRFGVVSAGSTGHEDAVVVCR